MEAPDDSALRLANADLKRLRPPNALAGDEARARHAAQVAAAEGRIKSIKVQRALARNFDRLRASRETVLLARELVTLRDDAPIHWDLAELPIGGWDVHEIQQALAALGFGRLAGVIESKPKARLT